MEQKESSRNSAPVSTSTLLRSIAQTLVGIDDSTSFRRALYLTATSALNTDMVMGLGTVSQQNDRASIGQCVISYSGTGMVLNRYDI